MKNLKLIGFLILAISSFIFIQCTTDTIEGLDGIAGADGIDGIDGVDGVDGTDAEATCVACHSYSHREPIVDSYAMSGHTSGNALGYAAYGADCASCHSNEGYVEFITTGSNSSKPTGTAIGCTTCHDTHSTFDFENDGHDYALRTFEPVELLIGSTLDNPSGILDFEGTSNNCTYCHQPRRTPPGVDSGMFTVPNHYGPHYGAQSTMLEGIQGANIIGSEEYPVSGTSTHRTAASCVSCHMGEPNSEDGAHTFNPTLNSCTQCHTSATDFDWHGVQTEVKSLMSDLEALLITNGILDAEGELITGDHPAGIAKAYWNWEYVYQDHSHGVHNPQYTLALLKNSIEYLEGLE